MKFRTERDFRRLCGEKGHDGPIDGRIGTNYVLLLGDDGMLHAGALNGSADGFSPRIDHLAVIYSSDGNPRHNVTERLTRVWRDEDSNGPIVRAEVRSASRFGGDPSRRLLTCSWLVPFRRNYSEHRGEEGAVWAVTREHIPGDLRDNLERRLYGAPLEVVGKRMLVTVPNEDQREYVVVGLSADSAVARLLLSSNQHIGAERPVVMAICLPFDTTRSPFAELYYGAPLELESVDFG